MPTAFLISNGMNLFDSIATVSFYGVMAALLITAFLTVTVRNFFHSAIFLAFTLLGVSIVYFFLHAEFVAGIQILLYVGAIMILIIFAVMLTSKIADPSVSQSNQQRFTVLILILLLGFILISTVLKTSWKTAAVPHVTSAVELGGALMGEFVFPFEVISIVLLIALIGAIVVARSDRP